MVSDIFFSLSQSASKQKLWHADRRNFVTRQQCKASHRKSESSFLVILNKFLWKVYSKSNCKVRYLFKQAWQLLPNNRQMYIESENKFGFLIFIFKQPLFKNTPCILLITIQFWKNSVLHSKLNFNYKNTFWYLESGVRQ